MDCQDLLATSPAFLSELLDIFSFLAFWVVHAQCHLHTNGDGGQVQKESRIELPRSAVCDYQHLSVPFGRQGGAGRHWIER